MTRFSLLALVAATATVSAHMSIFTPAMYGWMNWPDDPQAPLYELPFEQWWFRGYTHLSTGGKVEELTAGGTFTAEIACHVAWTKYGGRVSESIAAGSKDACPSSTQNAGPWHSSEDPNTMFPDINGVSGCALAIADVDDISKVGMDDLTIFSVNQKCVYRRETEFQIPAAMPKCTGSKCICAWFWLANYGQANFYMTAFDCSILQTKTDLPAIGKPQRPLWTGKYAAVEGPKLPLYAYNDGSTAEWFGNAARPGYHDSYGFKDGAQNDIFTGASTTIDLTAGSAKVNTTIQIDNTPITGPPVAIHRGSNRNSNPNRNRTPVTRQRFARHFGRQHGKHRQI